VLNRIRFNTDAGSEYPSIRYGAELAAAGIAPSVGSVGDSCDNALAESVIGLYKTEVIDHLGPRETPAQVEAATSEWVGWHSNARVMRRTGGRPPAGYEQAWRDGTLGQVPARGPGSRPRRPPEGGGDGRRSLPWRAPPAPAGARRPGEGCPTRRCPRPLGGGLAGRARHQAGQLDSAAGQMFDKQKRKMIRPWFRQAAVPWKTTATQTRASGENRVSTKLGVFLLVR
jgi:Integrase core domain